MLTAGTVVGVAVQQSVSADVSSGDRPVLIQITPCRLADTRPAPNNVGPRVGKLGPGETETFDVQEASTECVGKDPDRRPRTVAERDGAQCDVEVVLHDLAERSAPAWPRR